MNRETRVTAARTRSDRRGTTRQTVRRSTERGPEMPVAETPELQRRSVVSATRAGLRRQALARFLTSPKNPWFAKCYVNRMWTALMGWGFYPTVTDLGANAQPRHPAVLAQQALTTATAVGGRLLLGIGLSHKIVIEDMYGYSFDRPARHMREYLSILLPLLDGQQASFQG